MLAKIGLNDRGFGVCLNILRSADDGKHAGVPVHVLLRALLERDSVADAVAFASKLSFGASSNVLCADAVGRHRGAGVLARAAWTSCAARTRRCATPTISSPPAAASTQASLAPSLVDLPRLERDYALDRRAYRQSLGRRPAAHAARRIRRLSSICRSRTRRSRPRRRCIETVASVVMELAARVMHVAPDVPSRTAYATVQLRALAVA